MTHSGPYTHSHTDGGVNRAGRPGSVRSRCLAQGHLDTRGSNQRPSANKSTLFYLPGADPNTHKVRLPNRGTLNNNATHHSTTAHSVGNTSFFSSGFTKKKHNCKKAVYEPPDFSECFIVFSKRRGHQTGDIRARR